MPAASLRKPEPLRGRAKSLMGNEAAAVFADDAPFTSDAFIFCVAITGAAAHFRVGIVVGIWLAFCDFVA